jgi:hypothetical protein
LLEVFPRGGRGVKIKSKKQPQGRWVLNNGNKPLDLRTLPRCQATAKSTGRRCGNPAMKNKRVCYLHGGKSPGAPGGNRNALKHGFYTAGAIAKTLCPDAPQTLKRPDGRIEIPRNTKLP